MQRRRVLQQQAGPPYRAAHGESAQARDDFRPVQHFGRDPDHPAKELRGSYQRKTKKGAQALPQHSVCSHLTPAIFADGMDKGRLAKVCADLSCKSTSPISRRRRNSGFN